MKTALRIATILFALVLFITGCSADHKQPIEDLQTSDPPASAGEGEQLEVIATEPKDETPSEKPSEPSEPTEKTEATTKPTEEVEPSEATQSSTAATEKPSTKPTSKPSSGSSSSSQPDPTEPTEPPVTTSTAKPTSEPTEKTEAPTEPTEPPKVVYDIDAAMAAGNAYALQIGFGSIEYGFSPAAGNCGYYPCITLSGDLITSRGGQAALEQAARDSMASTKNQLVALLVNMDGKPAEDIKYFRVRSYISYDEATDKYKIYDLYG